MALAMVRAKARAAERTPERPSTGRPALSPFRRSSLLWLAAAALGAVPLLLVGVPSSLGWLLAINAATLGAYAVDKRAARLGASRTPEATLHLLAFVGGTPAALFAQQLLRHKTRDRWFQWVTTGVVVAQLLLVGGVVLRALR